VEAVTVPATAATLTVSVAADIGRGAFRMSVAPDVAGDAFLTALALHRRARASGASPADAAALFAEARSAWSAAGEPELAAVAQQAGASTSTGLARLDAALAEWRRLGNRWGEADALFARGALLAGLGDLPGARASQEEAVAVARDLGDPRREGVGLAALGETHEGTQESDLAMAAFDRAIPRCREARDRACEATALTDLGVMYIQVGDSPEAIRLLEEALPLWRARGDAASEATTLGNLGEAHSRLGNLGELQARPHHREEARRYLEQALAIHRQLGKRRSEAVTLSNLAMVDMGPGNPPLSRERLAQAADLMHEVGYLRGEAVALGNLSFMYTDAGEPRKGLPALERADALAERLDRTIRAILRWHRGRAEHHLGDLTAGIAHLQSAILEIERIRSQLSSADQRATFVGMTRMFFDALVDALADRYLRDGDEASAAEALSEVERARARSLLDRLAEARVDLRRGADPQLIAEESARRGSCGTPSERTCGSSRRKRSPSRWPPRPGRWSRSRPSWDRLSVRLRLASPAYAELTQPRPLDLASIRERVLDDHTVLLEYSLQEPRSYLWVATRRTLQLHVLPSGARIEALVRRAYGGWSVRTPLADDARAAAVELAQTVLGPAADALGDLRLLVVPDGALVSLPFSALPDPRAPAQPLLVRNEIVSAPSASVVAALRAPGRARRAPSSTLAVLADPVFTQGRRQARARALDRRRGAVGPRPPGVLAPGGPRDRSPGAAGAAPRAARPGREPRPRARARGRGGAPRPLRDPRLLRPEPRAAVGPRVLAGRPPEASARGPLVHRRRVQPRALGGPRGALRMPDGPWRGDQGRGPARPDARVHVRGSPARRGQPLDGGRRGHRDTHDPLLPRPARARGAAGGGLARGPVGAPEREPLRAPLLLGRLRAAGRLALRSSARPLSC
jgi:tetratricopeptide (TPR) repeat protein